MKVMGKDVQEDGPCGHSEVLAVLYGLIKTPERTSLHISKNACICPDCHTVISVLSNVEKGLISCRDIRSIHTFSEGKCCCGS
ncbi:hypothetical protein KP509_01G127500 [Ceratopteris richardii]|uniref:DYW domain-containing protein n=1 Tax=Ceratopteris richardii TaxID=49495 RepID=A0A8T2VR39_CERRI|nr:hypothetical protein KP509_01G127500 [Ceratopteris richardii]